jgi:DNA-binding NtrC family response regulator
MHFSIFQPIPTSLLEAVKETQPYGFMVKPFRERDMIVMLDIARYRYDMERGCELCTDTGNHEVIEGIIGKSKVLQDVVEKIRVVAPTDTSVLVVGESGTGKKK